MANRDLLKEAIADAKALKETAIANAKAALEEAFEPRLKSMLSAKLQEMDDEDEKNSTEEAKMTEAKKEYKDDDRKDGGRSKETKRTEKMKYGKDLAESEVDEEMDLDEILAELDEDARTDAEEEGYKDGMEDEKEDMDDMEDEDIDLEDMSEDDLKSFIEDVIADMVTAGELEAGEDFETEDEDEIDVEDDDDIDVEDDTEVDVEVNEEMRKDDMDETHTAMHGKDDMDEEMRKDDMDEAKYYEDDMKEAEEVDVEDNEDINIDDESTTSDIDITTSIPGESEDTEAVLGLLTKALDQAQKMGDEKLTDQIGNTITYFTRAHVARVDEMDLDMELDPTDVTKISPEAAAVIGLDEEKEDMDEEMRKDDMDEEMKDKVKENLNESIGAFPLWNRIK